MKKMSNITLWFILSFTFSLTYCQKNMKDLTVDEKEENIKLPSIPEADPSIRWGVTSWSNWNPSQVTRQTHPLIKGVPIVMKWKTLEPQPGVFKFNEILGTALTAAHQNNFNTFLMIWVGSVKDNGPDWLFENGVPKVLVKDDLDPLGNPRLGNYFAYYLDDDYIFYFHRLLDEFGKYVKGLPKALQDRVMFIQSAEGSTGDGQPYKSVPIDPQYNISATVWNDFRMNTWEVLNESFSNESGELIIPILVNFDANTDQENNWLLDNFSVIGAKQGMFSHGYHISETQDRIENWKKFTQTCKERDIKYFVRGEQDGEWETYGWSTKNKASGLYWSAIFATHCGVDMWNMPNGACKGYDYQDAVKFFNRHAAQHDPVTALGAFCALRKGLDAANTVVYPESVFGAAERKNIDRYLNIADAFKEYGAIQGDPEKAIGAGMVNRKRQDYNDVGWRILEGNYCRHITQIDPEGTSTGWWQKGPKESIYSRFARSTGKAKGNAMYFDLDDSFHQEGKNALVRIIWLDEGTAEWELLYDASGNATKTAFAIKNNNSGKWMEKIVELTDARLMNQGEKGADFIIRNNSEVEEAVFHMIEVFKSGGK
jgi:hypothetical protein